MPLYVGSEAMVDGANEPAVRLGVTPFVVGLTIVAISLSDPEAIIFPVSCENPEIMIGNIIGSNSANAGPRQVRWHASSPGSVSRCPP